MLSFAENLLLIVATVIASLVFMVVLNRFWPVESRRLHNDLIGWQLSVLGTSYAVIVGFMLYTVWTNLAAADTNADLEASAVVNIYKLSEGLVEPQRSELRNLAREYADTAVADDWPRMEAAQVPEQTVVINGK